MGGGEGDLEDALSAKQAGSSKDQDRLRPAPLSNAEHWTQDSKTANGEQQMHCQCEVRRRRQVSGDLGIWGFRYLEIWDHIVSVMRVLWSFALLGGLSTALSDQNSNGVLWMDVEWVLQCSSLKFDGFFTELLGYSSALAGMMPMARLVKSSFKTSFHEPILEVGSSLLSDLFPKERTAVDHLLSPYLPDMQAFSRPRSMFAPEVECVHCCEALHESSSSLVGGGLGKPRHPARSPESCCLACVQLTQCIAWEFDAISQQCSLKGYPPAAVPSDHPVTNGRMVEASGTASAPSRSPKPKALIVHGTTCVWMNGTLTRKRDVNTILIGRMMVERSAFSHGLSLGDFATAHCAGLVDELWVPTAWHKSVFSRLLGQYGMQQEVVVVPEAVDTQLFDPALLDPKQRKHCHFNALGQVQCDEGKRFVFLSVFKWEERKGWDVLLRAYWRAFTAADDVLLVIHSYTPPPHQQIYNITALIEEFANATTGQPLSALAAVHWLDDLRQPCPALAGDPAFTALFESKATFASADRAGLSRPQVRLLYAIGDAFVLPTRGEGWGLPIAEAMSMQLPVLVTNYSGPTAYLTADNSYPLEVEGWLDELSYAIPKEDHLVQLMRAVVLDSNTTACLTNQTVEVTGDGSADGCERANLTIAEAKGIRARRRMQEFSAEAIVSLMQERLRVHAERRGWTM